MTSSETPRDQHGSFRLGAFRALPALHRLVGAEGEVSLEPKAMQVLLRLARNPGEVVSTSALIEAVWGGEHISEEVVRRAIYTLRKALGDNPRSPRYIETIPRAGYRLVAEVEWGAEERAPRKPFLSGRWLPSGLGTALVIFLFLGVWQGWRTAPPEGTAEVPQVTLLTAQAGVEWQPALSPDGSRVAFLRAHDAGSELVVRLVDADSELVLAVDAAWPTWSPGGDHIAFLRRGKESCLLVTVPTLGGAERILVDLGPCAAQGLAWSPDGRWLVFGATQEEESTLRLRRLDLKSLTLETLTSPPPAMDDYQPAISPDGRQVAFLRNAFRGTTDLYTVPLAGGKALRLTPTSRTITDVTWTGDGQHLLFAVYEGGDHRLWHLPVAGGVARRLDSLGGGAMQVTTDRHRERLAYARVAFDYDFRRLDLERGTNELLGTPSSTQFDGEIDLSPDGQRLAFASTRSGSFEIWISELAGGQPRRLTAFGGPFTGQPRWSPDGLRIVFVSAASGDADLFTVDVRGGLPEPVTNHPAQEHGPSYTHDGRALLFASTRSGRWEIWRQELGGPEEPVRLTARGGFFAAEDPAGRFVYFVRPRSAGLFRIPASGGEEELVIEELSPRQWGNWLPTEGGVYFIGPADGGGYALRLFEEETGARHLLAALEKAPINGSLSLAPHRGELFFSKRESFESDIVVVDAYEM